MYYIDDEVILGNGFDEPIKKQYHIVARYTTDIVNNTMEVVLSSYDSFDSLIKGKDTGYTSFLTINDVPKFGVEPTLFILRAVTGIAHSPFYRKEIKLNYDVEHFTQLQIVRE